MNQHLAPIMDRRPLTAGRHNSRQRLPKPQTVSETPQNEQTPMRRDLIAAPRHPHITSAATVHLGDAPSSGSDTCLDTRIIPHRRGFSADAHPHAARTRERSGLDGRGYRSELDLTVSVPVRLTVTYAPLPVSWAKSRKQGPLRDAEPLAPTVMGKVQNVDGPKSAQPSWEHDTV